MDKIQDESTRSNHLPQTFFGILVSTVATYGLMRKSNYRVALLLYSQSGGGGLNFYKIQANGQVHRRFAIDYHPFWDDTKKQSLWRLHYHRGENYSQIRKHRPYEGGF